MIIEEVQKYIDDNGINEFAIAGYTFFDNMTIIGSRDISYYHQIEIVFNNVSYISCPTVFNDATFREASSDELKNLLKETRLQYSPYSDHNVFCIKTDSNDFELSYLHYIVAESMEYNSDFVYHYKRDDLKPNERIADWVK